MAGLFATINTGAAIGTTAGRKTILQISAPADKGLRVSRVSVSCNSSGSVASANNKGIVDIERATTLGSGGTDITSAIRKIGGHTGNPTATAREDLATPSSGQMLAREAVAHNGGYTFPEEFILNPGETLSISATFALATAMIARARWEE